MTSHGRKLLLALVVACCLATPAGATAQTFKVAVIRATFANDASRGATHIFSLADITTAGLELQQYYDELSNGHLSLRVGVANAPDLAPTTSYADDTALFRAALDSAGRNGYGGAVSGAGAVILLAAGTPYPFCGAYYGQLPLTSYPGGLGDIKLEEGCEGSTPIGTEPHPAPVDWGGWAHEIGHALQATNGRDVYHPANYGDGYNLMDSCYPCGAGVFDLTGAPIVGGTLSSFPGWLPRTKVAVLPAASGRPTTTTIDLAPLGVRASTTPRDQGIKVPIDPVSAPVGGGLTWHGGSYYLIEQRERTGADGFGAVGQPRLVDEGVEIHEVNESAAPPVKVIRPCDETPIGRRCEGDPGAEFTNAFCNANPAPLQGSCWPFDLWHPGETLHGLDGINITVGPHQPGTQPVTVTRGTRAHGPDPYIIPWQTPPMNTWETVDLWIDSSCNGYEYPSGPSGPHNLHALRYGRRPGASAAARTVISNGDDPCGDHENRVYARIHNGGDLPARNVRVKFSAAYHNFVDPGSPQLADLGTARIRSIPAGGFVDTYVNWTPSGGPLDLQQPDWIQGLVEPSGSNVSSNTFARENVLHFDVRSGTGLPSQVYPHLPLPILQPGDPARYLSLQATRIPRGAQISLSHPLSFKLTAGKTQREVPIDIRVPAKARAGSSFVFDVQTRELGTDPVSIVGPTSGEAAVHHGVDTEGGLAIIAHVVKASSLSVASHSASNSVLSVSGRLSPALKTTVAIDYLTHRGASAALSTRLITHLVSTDGNGRFTDRLQRPGASRYRVRAIWMGDQTHAAVMSGTKMHRLPAFKAPHLPVIPAFGSGAGPSPQLADSLSVGCPQTATVGNAYTVQGTLGPRLAGRQIAVVYTEGAGASVHVVTTGAEGTFSDSVTPQGTGTWTVSASWPGDLTYDQSFSTLCSTTVTLQPTSLTLICPGKTAVQGQLAIQGALEPGLPDAPIKITYGEPNGSVADNLSTDAIGGYSDTRLAVPSGTWQIQASYAGDGQHAASTSTVCTTTVS